MPDAFRQNLDPLGNAWLSTFFAALPILVLFWLLVPRRWLAPKAGLGAVLTALAIAVFIYGMPWWQALLAFLNGVGFGLLPVGWNILGVMFLFNLTVEAGQFTTMRRSVAGLSPDARVQAVLIGFAFGAFLEGSAGGGTPVAICAAIMVGLGFPAFQAAVLCLIANTSPVAFGGLGMPLIVLGNVTGLHTPTLSVMAGHQLPILSLVIPLWMVRCLCPWRQTLAVWPVLLVAGGSFALAQYFFATMHTWIEGLELWPMTDIAGGVLSLVVTALFLRVWQPREVLRLDQPSPVRPQPEATPAPGHGEGAFSREMIEARGESEPLTPRRVVLAWLPYLIMSVLLLLSGLLRQAEQRGPVGVGWFQSEYILPIPGLDGRVLRDEKLRLPGTKEEAEKAVYRLSWLSAPGTACFVAAFLSLAIHPLRRDQLRAVGARTFRQMKIPIPTIALMIGLSYITRFSGQDATLGVAFAQSGVLYPFFAAMLGWLGVFLTGTDAGSNALFGSLQKITATEIFQRHGSLFQGLDLRQVQTLITTANSTGGVMGKMIDAQSICVATAATHQLGKEADIFKAVIWHSVVLAAIVGGLVLLQAYVVPFTWLVP